MSEVENLREDLRRKHREVAVDRSRMCFCVNEWRADPRCPDCHATGMVTAEPVPDHPAFRHETFVANRPHPTPCRICEGRPA